jgi:hypothetical protein
MRVRRFYYTGPSRSDVAHICYSRTHVEGNPTACGRLTAKGWYWWRKASRFFRLCTQCARAAS